MITGNVRIPEPKLYATNAFRFYAVVVVVAAVFGPKVPSTAPAGGTYCTATGTTMLRFDEMATPFAYPRPSPLLVDGRDGVGECY